MIFEKKQTIDFREIRRMLWRRRVVILIPMLITVAAGIAGIVLSEPKYASTATLVLETPAPLINEINNATGLNRRNDAGIRILRKKMQASQFLERVAVQIGLHEAPRIVAKAQRQARENPGHDVNNLLLRECVAVLNRMLDVRADGDNVFYVRAVSNSGEVAHAVASTVADQYIQESQRDQLATAEQSSRFAKEQVAIYERKLEEKRQALRSFEQQAALRGFDSSPVSEANLSRVNTLLADADLDTQRLESRHDAIKSQIAEAGLEPFLALDNLKSERLDALKITLKEFEENLAMTLIEYEDGDPSVRSAKNQIAATSQQMLTELESLAELKFPSIVDNYRQLLVDHNFMELSKEAAAVRKVELTNFLERYAEDLSTLPANEFRLERLKEDVASAERIYQTWVEQANAAQINIVVSADRVGNRISLIEPAQLPLAPFAPQKPRILMLAVVMGLALGVGAALVMEYLDLTLKSVEEIEMVMGVQILGAVPRMQAAVIQDLETKRRNRLRILIPSLILTLLAFAALAYWYFFLESGGLG